MRGFGLISRYSTRVSLVALSTALCVWTIFLVPATVAAPQMKWHCARFLHEDPFKTRLTLLYGVPETDLSQLIASCHIGNSGTYVTIDVSAEVGSLPANTPVKVQFAGNGLDQVVDASVVRAQEVGITGVSIAVDLDDPLWQAIRGQSFLDYNVTGFTASRLQLGGSQDPTSRFLADCREMPKPEVDRKSDAPAKPGEPRSATCDSLGDERSRRSDVPISVTFRNRSEGMRGVMWIDFNGRPVEYATLAPGETFTINTYMTHPWMFTDGPGNCIEMFMPKPGVTSFAITTPNRNFGPE